MYLYGDLKVAAVLPAYNEEKYIEYTIDMIPKDIVDYIIVVDDASTDRTGEIAKEKGVMLIRHEVNRGVGAALKTGFIKALELNADVVVVIPGDGQADIGSLPRLLDKIKEGYGLVISNRFAYDDPRKYGMPNYRYYASKVLALITFLLTGVYIQDPQSGFKAVGKEALEKINVDELYDRWGIHNDMISMCKLAKIKITTVPAKPVYILKGERVKSHINVFDLMFKHLVVYMKIIKRNILYIFGKYKMGRGRR